METTMIRMANEQDVPTLVEFLEKANLGTDGVKETVDYFLLMEDGSGSLCATLGVEPFGQHGLLRSLVITAGMKENEILMLFEQILLLSKEKNLTSLYMATNKTTSVPFFEMLGFSTMDKEELPVELYQSEHIKNILTVDNSIFLKFQI